MIREGQIRQWADFPDDLFKITWVGEKKAVITYYNGADQEFETKDRLKRESIELVPKENKNEEDTHIIDALKYSMCFTDKTLLR